MPHCPHTQKERSAIALRLTELSGMVSEDSNRFVSLVHEYGAEAVVGMLDEFGSEKIHVPTPDSLVNGMARLCRDEEIRGQYVKGQESDNAEELAITYSDVLGLGKISPTRVRQVVSNEPRRYTSKPASFTSVKLYRDGAYKLLRDEAFNRGGVALHEVLAVIVEVGLVSQDVRDKLDAVFGVQETFDIAVNE